MEHELTSMLLEDALESNFDDYSSKDDINEDDDFLNEYLNACESFMDELEAELMFDSAMEASGTDNSDKLEELASRARAAEAAMKSAKNKAAKEKAMQEYNSIMQELAVEEKNAKDDAKKKKVKKVIKIVGASILAAAAVFGIAKGAKALKNRKNIKTSTGNNPSNGTATVVSDKKVENLQDVVNEPDPTVSELKTAIAPVIAEVIAAPSEPSSSAEPKMLELPSNKTLALPEHDPHKNAVDTGNIYGPNTASITDYGYDDPKKAEAAAKTTLKDIMKNNPGLTPQDKKDLLTILKHKALGSFEFIDDDRLGSDKVYERQLDKVQNDMLEFLRDKSPAASTRRKKLYGLITDSLNDAPQGLFKNHTGGNQMRAEQMAWRHMKTSKGKNPNSSKK